MIRRKNTYTFSTTPERNLDGTTSGQYFRVSWSDWAHPTQSQRKSSLPLRSASIFESQEIPCIISAVDVTFEMATTDSKSVAGGGDFLFELRIRYRVEA